jgi:hypothetical protein
VRRKRIRAALKADPEAAAWSLEAAELAFEEGREDDARVELERAVELDERAGAAWELLAALERRARQPARASEAYAKAAEAALDEQRRAERFAEAARAAAEAGREEERGRYAARAGDAEVWLADARQLLDEGDLDGALNRATLAEAVRPDEKTRREVQLVRARMSLRPIQ